MSNCELFCSRKQYWPVNKRCKINSAWPQIKFLSNSRLVLTWLFKPSVIVTFLISHDLRLSISPTLVTVPFRSVNIIQIVIQSRGVVKCPKLIVYSLKESSWCIFSTSLMSWNVIVLVGMISVGVSSSSMIVVEVKTMSWVITLPVRIKRVLIPLNWTPMNRYILFTFTISVNIAN